MSQDKIIVAFDLGTTSSAVAWVYSQEPTNIRTIDHWPSNSGSIHARRVPTQLRYKDKDKVAFDWGFSIPAHAQAGEIRKWFKLYCLSH